MPKVYVLGAGASTEFRAAKDPSVPTDKTFWSALERVIAKNHQAPKVNEKEYVDYEQLVSFLKKKYKVRNLSSLDKLGLEKVFSDIDSKTPEYLDVFVRLLSWVLFQIIRAINERTAPIHYRLVQEKIRAGDTIITFNYDVIIEQVIWSCARRNPGSLQWHPSTGYHIDFAGYLKLARPQNPPLPLQKSISDVFICKLHGSTGWFAGESDGADANKTYLFLAEENGILVGEGFLPRKRILVPPIQRKEFPSILNYIWIKAEEALVGADAVTFIGYRFPEADKKAISLFTKTCKDKPTEIVLKGLRANDELRFRSLFTKLKLIDRSFSSWLSN